MDIALAANTASALSSQALDQYSRPLTGGFLARRNKGLRGHMRRRHVGPFVLLKHQLEHRTTCPIQTKDAARRVQVLIDRLGRLDHMFEEQEKIPLLCPHSQS